MKKSVILAIAGFSLTITLAKADGNMSFNTYLANNSTGIEVTYDQGPLAGQGIDNTFTGVLLYSENPIFETATTAATVWQPLNSGWSVASTGTFDLNCPAGYIDGPYFHYTGSDTTLYFEIAAFNGLSWDSSFWRGHSASFTAALVTTINPPNPNQLNNMQPFQVFGPVPEPATLAFDGLGLAALCLFRRGRSR